MKLTRYIKHTRNGIQCEFARNQKLRTETRARRNFALLTLYFAFTVITKNVPQWEYTCNLG